MRGKFLLIDGPDGCGKDVFLAAMQAEAEREGKRVFDLHAYWAEHGTHPPIEAFSHADMIISSEPTGVGDGKRIRDELIRRGSTAGVREIAEAYAEDRQALYEQVLIPALEKGIGVIQTRSVSSSLVYQPLDAAQRGEDITLDEIKALPGNRRCLQKDVMPDLVVIPTVSDVEELMRRLGARAKQDDARFERRAFLQQVKEGFASPWFRTLYERAGAKVVYADAEASLARSKEEAVRLYHELFG